MQRGYSIQSKKPTLGTRTAHSPSRRTSQLPVLGRLRAVRVRATAQRANVGGALEEVEGGDMPATCAGVPSKCRCRHPNKKRKAVNVHV